MTAQPSAPAHGPDTGSYEVIHLGGHAAVVVPVADFMRLRALERLASAQELEDPEDQELEDPEDTAALQGWRAREAAGQPSCVPACRGMAAAGPDQVSFRVIYEEKAIDQAQGSSLMIPPVSARCWTPSAGWPVIPGLAGSFPYGSPDLRRLRVGRYEINGDVVPVWHIASGKTSC